MYVHSTEQVISNGNNSDLYLRVVQFESSLGDWLSGQVSFYGFAQSIIYAEDRGSMYLQNISSRLYSFTSQMTVMFVVTAVRTSDLNICVEWFILISTVI